MFPFIAAAPIIGAGISALAGLFGARSSNKSNEQAARYAMQQNNYAANLQSRAAAEQLAFLKQQEDTRRKEWERTQARNYGIYQEDVARGDRYRSEDIARREPFRRFSVGALQTAGKPIYAPGSIGSLLKR